MEQSKVVWEEMAKNWPPLDFLVRSKNCAFLENLEHYKKTEHRVQLVLEHFVDFQDQNIVTSHSTVSQISTFPKLTYYISLERLFSTDQFLLKDLVVYDSCSWLGGLE